MAITNYFKMYRELYDREFNRDPLRHIAMNVLFVIVGSGMSYYMYLDVSAGGCLQLKGRDCITAASNPFQYYLYTNWFLIFTVLGLIGLVTSIRTYLKKRKVGKQSR